MFDNHSHFLIILTLITLKLSHSLVVFYNDAYSPPSRRFLSLEFGLPEFETATKNARNPFRAIIFLEQSQEGPTLVKNVLKTLRN